MCLIVFAYRCHPRHHLVVGANRDEFHERPTAPAAFWDDEPRILAGRDLLGRGTWLGVTRDARFAALTNYRAGADERRDAPSRGNLVSGFLRCSSPPDQYLDEVAHRGAQYNGFSLVVGDGSRLGWYSNRADAPRMLSPGIYGLSNALLDTSWPRVDNAKRELEQLIARDSWTAQELLAFLDDREPAAEADLPDTGVGPERERWLSPLFITGEHYGTRSSTALVIDEDGRIDFTERSFEAGGVERSTVHFELVPGLSRAS